MAESDLQNFNCDAFAKDLSSQAPRAESYQAFGNYRSCRKPQDMLY